MRIFLKEEKIADALALRFSLLNYYHLYHCNGWLCLALDASDSGYVVGIIKFYGYIKDGY